MSMWRGLCHAEFQLTPSGCQVNGQYQAAKSVVYPSHASLLQARQSYSWMSLPAVCHIFVSSSSILVILIVVCVGLDAYNALSVVDSLVSLARDYNRTVVFTIHQPRSNIVALFDKLVLLAKGKLVYSGEASKCYDYLQSIGNPCPPGFNLADFLSKSFFKGFNEDDMLI